MRRFLCAVLTCVVSLHMRTARADYGPTRWKTLVKNVHLTVVLGEIVDVGPKVLLVRVEKNFRGKAQPGERIRVWKGETSKNTICPPPRWTAYRKGQRSIFFLTTAEVVHGKQDPTFRVTGAANEGEMPIVDSIVFVPRDVLNEGEVTEYDVESEKFKGHAFTIEYVTQVITNKGHLDYSHRLRSLPRRKTS